jgi:transcriptional regulator with XRE-family HTH domain
MDVGLLIRELRTEAGLSQAKFAARVGTSQAAVSRLESADYKGHSLAMLRRVVIALVPVDEACKAAAEGERERALTAPESRRGLEHETRTVEEATGRA